MAEGQGRVKERVGAPRGPCSVLPRVGWRAGDPQAGGHVSKAAVTLQGGGVAGVPAGRTGAAPTGLVGLSASSGSVACGLVGH